MSLSFDPKDVEAQVACDLHLMETGETLHPSYVITQFKRLSEACAEVVAFREKLFEMANARTRGGEASMKFHPAWWQEGMLDD